MSRQDEVRRRGYYKSVKCFRDVSMEMIRAAGECDIEMPDAMDVIAGALINVGTCLADARLEVVRGNVDHSGKPGEGIIERLEQYLTGLDLTYFPDEDEIPQRN